MTASLPPELLLALVAARGWPAAELRPIASLSLGDGGADIRVAQRSQLDRADGHCRREHQRSVLEFLGDVLVVVVAPNSRQASPPSLIDYKFCSHMRPDFLPNSFLIPSCDTTQYKVSCQRGNQVVG